MRMRCPGQDPRFWKPTDVFEAPCPGCGNAVEFFKDDVARRCPRCGARFENPRLDRGCAQWCKAANECLGMAKIRATADDPRSEGVGSGERPA